MLIKATIVQGPDSTPVAGNLPLSGVLFESLGVSVPLPFPLFSNPPFPSPLAIKSFKAVSNDLVALFISSWVASSLAKTSLALANWIFNSLALFSVYFDKSTAFALFIKSSSLDLSGINLKSREDFNNVLYAESTSSWIASVLA